MDPIFVLICGILAVFSWWLSGFDARVTGEDPGADFMRRALRCAVTLFLVGLGSISPWIMIPVIVMIAILWASCLSAVFTGGFYGLIDTEDKRPLDLRQPARDLDRLAALVQEGRYLDAMNMSQTLAESGQASALAMEATLFQIWGRMFAEDCIRNYPFLAEAVRLRAQKNFPAAEASLKKLLEREPNHLATILLLAQIYAQDFNSQARAESLLDDLGRRPGIPPAFVKYARSRLAEWIGLIAPSSGGKEGIESLLVDVQPAQKSPVSSNASPASVEELLKAGHLATAIEILERQTAEAPGDFELWMRLAEAHGKYCRNRLRAGKIIAKMAAQPAFSPQQILEAKAKLKEWNATV